jgi:8-oxo-dGTP pyrophosphatase MutT (NUDIX family)
LVDVPAPHRLVAAAREHDEGGRRPAVPRDAATVMLIRPGERGPEVYLLRRHTAMAFAGGMCVFPGGGVDARDHEPISGWSGPAPSVWAERMGAEESLGRALVAAAVRETFEESGVLLAGVDRDHVVADTTGDDWEADRRALEDGDLSLGRLLERRGLVLRADLLGLWSGWLTPVFEPRRYRTWFFVAELPAGQRTRDVSTESDRVVWLSAADAARAVERRELAMLPPTYLTCLELAEHHDTGDVIAAARDRDDVEMFLPEIVDGEVPTLSVPERYSRLSAAGLRSEP